MNDIKLRKNPRPWMTNGSIDFIEQNLLPTDNVIEFGGGWSSIWWAKRANYTLTVEASPEWAATIIKEMMTHPDAMAKWSMKFVPSDWNPTPNEPKQYWKANGSHLTEDNIANLTMKYLSIDFDADVIVIDGSIRPTNIDVVNQYLKHNNRVRMIVVDNMESLRRYTLSKFEGYEQYDFFETDLSLIPTHQNGKWCTSVWIKIK